MSLKYSIYLFVESLVIFVDQFLKNKNRYIIRVKIVLAKFPRENLHLENFHPSNSPLLNSSRKIPTWNIPTHVFKYFHSSFLNFLFFHYCHRYRWYYLKDCFVILCFKSPEAFTLVNICQNEVVSEERQLMKWVGIFQMRIFLREFSRGKIDWWEFSRWEFS